MSKLNKSELCKGLEDEHLNKKKDYLPPDEWKKVKTFYGYFLGIICEQVKAPGTLEKLCTSTSKAND